MKFPSSGMRATDPEITTDNIKSASIMGSLSRDVNGRGSRGFLLFQVSFLYAFHFFDRIPFL